MNVVSLTAERSQDGAANGGKRAIYRLHREHSEREREGERKRER